MKRASTDNEGKRGKRPSTAPSRPSSGSSSSQRLAAAGLRALEAHSHVRRFAEQLGGELNETAEPHDVLTARLEPEDPMVVAVEKAIEASSTMIAVEKAITRTASMTAVSEQVPSTKLGIGTPIKAKTKLGIGPPAKRSTTDDE